MTDNSSTPQTTTRKEGFRDQALSGIRWSVLAQVARQAFSFAIGVVLARLLNPEAFGLIGMIVVFSGFAAVFSDMGFSAALIQRKDPQAAHYTGVFWINVATGLALTGAFVVLAPLIARFYDQQILVPLTMVLATSFLAGSLGIVHRTVLNKQLAFRKLALVDVATTVIAGSVAIVLAVLGLGVWSLAVQSVMMAVLGSLLLWWAVPWRPSASFSWTAVRELWGFSSRLMGFNTLNYWVRNADNLLVGRVLGTAPLGLYTKAYGVMLFPVSNVTATISRVMFPAFSTIQDDPARIGRVYLRMTRAIGFVTFPMMVGLLLTADHFVLGLFGRQWDGMVGLLRILSLVGLLQSIGALNGNIYLALGRSDLQFKVGGTIGVVGVAAIILGLRWGVEGVAGAYAVFSLLAFYPSVRIAVSLIDLSFSDVIRSLVRVVMATAVMALAVGLTSWLLPEHWPHLPLLAAESFVGVAVYAAYVHGTNLPAYVELKMLVRNRGST